MGKSKNIPVFSDEVKGGITDKYLEGISSIPEEERGKKKEELSIFSKVILFINNPLLASGIILTDTPGRKIYNIHNEITSGSISNADLVLLVLDAHSGLTDDEMDNLKNEFDRFGKNILIIANRVDSCYREKTEKAQRMKLINEKKTFLINHVEDLISTDRVYVISAQIGLWAKIQPSELNDEMDVEKDIFIEFKHSVETFLTKDAYTNKLISNAFVLKEKANKICVDYIPKRQTLLSGEIETIKANADLVIKRVEFAKKLLETTISGIEKEVSSVQNVSVSLVEEYLKSLYNVKITTWVMAFSSSGTPSELPNIFASYIRKKVKSDFEDWCNSALSLEIKSRMNRSGSYLNEEKLGIELDQFFREKIEIEGLVDKEKTTDTQEVILNRKRFFANWKASMVKLSGGEQKKFIDFSVADLFASSITTRINDRMPFDEILSQGGFYYEIAKIFEWLYDKLKTNSTSWWGKIRNFLADLFSNWSSLIASAVFTAFKPDFIAQIKAVLHSNHDNIVSSMESIIEEYNEKMVSIIEGELVTDLNVVEKQAIIAKKNAEIGKEKVEEEINKLTNTSQQIKKIETNVTNFISRINQ